MQKSVFKVFCSLVLTFLLISFVTAHEEETASNESLTTISLVLITLTSINVLVLLAVSCRYKKHKKAIFLTMVIPIILTTLFLVISTIYINLNSQSEGPVHWHADYEIWACGEKLNLIDPEGFSNKVGTNLFHEHNDDRMHIEGVVEDLEEINLQHFIEIIGGEISASAISLITNEGFVTYENGQQCNGVLQAFVYKTEHGEVTQEKEENFLEYIPSPYSQVPPGDCIIIEFGEKKEITEHICETYKNPIEGGEIHGS